jgi:hypothetical protein
MRGNRKEDARRSYLKLHLAIIKKIEPSKIKLDIAQTVEDLARLRLSELSIAERYYVAEALRRQWLPKNELRKYRQQQKLKHIEATQKLAKYGVEFGKRTEFVQKVTGYDGSPEALKQFKRRARKRRR